MIYAAKGDTADLAAELERVQELAPEDLDVKLDLGSAYQRIGDNEQGDRRLRRGAQAQPQATSRRSSCSATAIAVSKDPEKAIAAYQRARKLAPEDPRPYFLLGAAYEEAGDDVKAEAVFQDAQQFQRYLGEAWINLGVAGVPPRRSVEGQLVPLARGGARADAAQGALQLRAGAVGEEGARPRARRAEDRRRPRSRGRRDSTTSPA